VPAIAISSYTASQTIVNTPVSPKPPDLGCNKSKTRGVS
jgi:hypothetical protein